MGWLLVDAGGSSPLSRGIRCCSRRSHRRRRIIPALAGNTARTAKPGINPGDHPRSRGEYYPAPPGRKPCTGSSPLSRGIRGRLHLGLPARRIIPALAGNTPRFSIPQPARWDHPRSRGEYLVQQVRHGDGPGSSPLSRGIPGRLWRACPGPGIIPALAGNTLADKGFYQLDLSDLGNPLLARLRFSKSLAPRLRRPSSWRGESFGSSPEGPGRTIRVSPS